MIIYECANHGILNESNSWVDKNGRVICGKCGKPGFFSDRSLQCFGQVQYGAPRLSNGEILKH